ncbi:hypothetical protein ES703_77896 [subsurface metagenome]
MDRLNNGELAEKIQRILVNAIDSPSGGLFVAEIQMTLFDEGIEVSTQKLINVIRWRGRHIKIQPIMMPGNKWMNMYYTNPLLELKG